MTRRTLDVNQAAERIHGGVYMNEDLPPILPVEPGDHSDAFDGVNAKYVIGNSYVAMLLFIGAELMLFAGLIAVFIVFRFGGTEWPPPLQPRLPVAVTGVNTVILLVSGYTMLRAWKLGKSGNRKLVLRALVLTGLFGTIFLIIQGYEWARLLRFGLTIESGVYGASFYVLIGCHALHVLGALIWLLTIINMARDIHFLERKSVALNLCSMYWGLVVALWPILYVLVYLS